MSYHKISSDIKLTAIYLYLNCMKNTGSQIQEGFRPTNTNAVATMANRHPSNTAPTAWYEAARSIDQNRASNEAFRSTHRTHAPLLSHLCPLTQYPPRATTLTQAHVKPTPGHPVSMDIDINQRRILSLSPSCYRCGKPGHKVPDCPLRFDIRAWTTEELEAEIEVRLSQRDAVPLEECPSIVEEDVATTGFLQNNEWIAHLCCPHMIISKFYT
jgi:hypothetical protein